MFYLKKQEKSNCTGCQACKQVCPKNAIDMIEDEEGFLYPQKNSNCIECGICERVCPLNVEKTTNNMVEQEVYAGIYKDENILTKSSSGGAFTAICNSFCDENYCIFGVGFDKEFNVKHSYIENIKEIDLFRKSKYVQSDVGNSYNEAKNFLEQGKKVIFSGTPCQIAGLQSFLKNKQYKNLLCIDIICHGVPSLKVWKQYTKYVENKYNSKIKNINFREKTNKNDEWNSKNIKIELENDKCIIKDSVQDYYLRGFQNELLFRPSCKECKFANPKRISDITIGDCWGISKYDSELNVHKGVSILVFNTEKGKKVKENIEKYMKLKQLDLNFAITENAQFREPTKFHKNRDKFYKNKKDIRFDKLINKYVKAHHFKRKISKLIPNIIKKKLKK